MVESGDSGAELGSLRAVWPHRGVPAEWVRQLKYGERTAAVTVLADAMAELAAPADVVTWCPASPMGRRARGYDQSELLARAIAHRLDLPARRLLRRGRRDRAQTRRDRAGRLVGPRLRAARTLPRRPTVLLVDDVTTTGTTLRSAAALLYRAGAGWVHGLVATHADSTAGLTRPEAPVYGPRAQATLGGNRWTSPSAHGT